MPLPAALAARLAKRGLVKPSDIEAKDDKKEEEEVIAEDYDEKDRDKMDGLDDDDKEMLMNLDKKFLGHPGCPNKYNIYHDCSKICQELWGSGRLEPDPQYMRKKLRMLVKYPLPDNWKEVYDPGVARFYYWETDTDAVSWLPPGHPKASLSMSAAHLREERHMAEGDQDDDDEDDDEDDDVEDGAEQMEEDDKEPEDDIAERKQRLRDERERQRARGRQKTRDNDLDPMDPASYSDIPRGTWATGLPKQNEAKSGVDPTASGPLYQMRPYPSPGAVLRANSSKKPPPPGKTVSKPEMPS